MADDFKRMRELREQAEGAFAQIDAQLRALHGIMGAWTEQTNVLAGTPKKKKKRATPSKYVALAITLAADSDDEDGWVSLDDIEAAAATKWPDSPPIRGNIKRALEASDLLEGEAEKYRAVSD